MAYFPFFMELENETALVVGGGKIAVHKVEKLLPYGVRLVVVAPKLNNEMQILQKQGKIDCKLRDFTEADVENKKFVIAATDAEKTNRAVADACNKRNIPVNVVDDKDKCTFLFPSLIKEGSLSIGISTAGASPWVASNIRKETAMNIPSNMEEILDYLQSVRVIAKERITDSKQRAAFLKECADITMEKNRVFTEAEFAALLDTYTQTEQEYHRERTQDATDTAYAGRQKTGFVSLVGAGCSSMDYITVKGLKEIRKAEVLVYDDLIDERILDCVAENCKKVYVGKRSGKHSRKQEEINQLLVDYAKKGYYVVRLKGGDPYVFGRGGEEVLACKEAGIATDVTSGITSSIALAAKAGIPVTHRKMSRSFHVITGHIATKKQSESGINAELLEEMRAIAKCDGTAVILMGLSNLETIVSIFKEGGKRGDTPAAVLHGEFNGEVQAVRATLDTIVPAVQKANVPAPAVIVIGETVGLCL